MSAPTTKPGALALDLLARRADHGDSIGVHEAQDALADLRDLIARAERAEADVERLREALTEIVTTNSGQHWDSGAAMIARAALAATEGGAK